MKGPDIMSELHCILVVIKIFLYLQLDVCKYFAKGGIPSGNTLFPTVCNQGKERNKMNKSPLILDYYILILFLYYPVKQLTLVKRQSSLFAIRFLTIKKL